MINKYFLKLKKIVEETNKEEINKIVDTLFDAWKEKKVVFVMGCGGSASTATHFVSDISKSAGIKAISIVDNIPLNSAWTNDESWENVFEKQLETWIEKGDVLVGFSVHGGRKDWSNNLTKAMELAKEREAKIIGFSGFDGGMMKKVADICLVVPIDSEPLGTPLIESFHVVLHHLICLMLTKKIEQFSSTATE